MSGSERRKKFRIKGHSRSMEKIEDKQKVEEKESHLFIQPKFISQFILLLMKNPTRNGMT